MHLCLEENPSDRCGLAFGKLAFPHCVLYSEAYPQRDTRSTRRTETTDNDRAVDAKRKRDAFRKALLWLQFRTLPRR